MHYVKDEHWLRGGHVANHQRRFRPVVPLAVVFLCVLGACAVAQAKTTLMQEDVGLYNVRQNNPTGATNAATINAACAHANSANKIIFLTPGTWTLEADVVCTAGRGLMIAKGAAVNRNGHVLTVNGPFWDLNASPEEGWNVRACGAKVDGVTDDTAALNACLATFTHVFVPQGLPLLHTGTIIVNIGNRLSGAWQGVDSAAEHDANLSVVQPYVYGSSLHYTGAGIAVQMSAPTVRDCHCEIDHLRIYSGTGTDGVYVHNLIEVTIDTVSVDGQTYPLTTQGFSVAALHFNQSLNGTDFVGIIRVVNSSLRYTAGYGLKADGGNNLNGFVVTGNHIQGNGKGGIYGGGHALGWDVGGNIIEGNGGANVACASGTGNQIYSFYPDGWNIHGNYTEPPAGTNCDVYRFESAAALSIVGNLLGGGASTPGCLIHLGTNGQYLSQGVTIASNSWSHATTAVCLEFVRGVTIRDNVAWFALTTELGGTFNLVEGVSYQQMTRQTIGGEPLSVIESTPTVVCMDNSLVSFASSAAENILYSCVIGPYMLANAAFNGGLRLALQGGVTVGAAGPSDFTVRVKYGATTFSTLRWQAVANSGGGYALVIRGQLTGTAAGLSKEGCWFEGLLGAANSSVTGTTVDTGATQRFHTCNTSAAGVDFTVAQTLQITIQASVSSANVSMYKESASAERLPY